MESYVSVWPPNMVLLTLVIVTPLLFATFDARKQKPFWGKTIAAILIMVVSWFVDGGRVISLALPIFYAGIFLDGYQSIQTPKERRSYVVWVPPAMLLVGLMSYMSWQTRPKELQLRVDSLALNLGSNVAIMPKQSLRIVEFGVAPGREWHIKDGVQVTSIWEDESFADAHGNPWSSREVVNRIETWAGVVREHRKKPPEVATVAAAAPVARS